MSGDIERDAEKLNDQSQYPEHLRTPPDKVLSANQLIAFNMWRARRGAAWSQQEVAELLEMYTGRSWSNASVSAAERSWQGGRPRRFDANEILALSKIFDEPIFFFFLPPEDGRWNRSNVGMREFPDEHPNMDPEDKDSDLMGLIPTADYIGSLGLYQITPALEFRIQDLALRHLGLSWTPPKWKMPFRHTPRRPNGELDWNSSGEPEVARFKEGGKQAQKEDEKLSLGDNVTVTTNPDTGEQEIVLTVTREELAETIRNVTQQVMQEALGKMGVSGEQIVRPPSDSDVLEDE